MNQIGIVFTGQGSQRIGMAKDFYNEYERTRQAFDSASESIGIDIAKLCFEENDEINLTKNTQPALLTVEIGIYNAIKGDCRIHGNYFAGHSLGEYSALAAASVIPFVDAVKIVRKRGSLMQEVPLPPGEEVTMAALIHENLESTEYKDILSKNNIEIANFNSKKQVVITGLKKTIDAVTPTLKGGIPGIDVVELNVRSPFHSKFMKAIESEFNDYLLTLSKNFDLQNSNKVLSNLTGGIHDPKCLIDNLTQQLSSPVKWIDNMNVVSDLCNSVYEIGPNRVLGKFFSTIGLDVKSIINLRALDRIFPNFIRRTHKA